MLLNSLVKVSACVADIACIAQATLKMIHSALLIYKGWLVFPHFYFILDLPTCVHRADIHIDLPTEVSKLSAHCVCRFLIFERQHYSDGGFLLLRYLLLGTWILRYFWINELADGRYKRSLLNTMLNRAFKLSSTWKLFHQECERLKEIFSRLRYPDKLVQSTIRQFTDSTIQCCLKNSNAVQKMSCSLHYPKGERGRVVERIMALVVANRFVTSVSWFLIKFPKVLDFVELARDQRL